MKLFFWAAVICALLCLGARGEEQKEQNEQEEEEEEQRRTSAIIQRWRMGVQEILTSVVAGPLGKDFSPSYVAKRAAPNVLKKQVARIRGQALSAVLETLGTRVELCFARRFEDEAVSALKREIADAGFQVDWEEQSERSDPSDPRWCFAGRETMVIRVPPAAAEEKEEEKKEEL